MKKYITAAEREALLPKVKELYEQGMTKAEIWRVLGDRAPSIGTLQRMLDCSDVAKVAVTAELKADIVANVVFNGVSAAAAAHSVGLSGSAVLTWKKQLFDPDTMSDLDFDALVSAMIEAEHQRVRDVQMAKRQRSSKRSSKNKLVLSAQATTGSVKLPAEIQQIVDEAKAVASPKSEDELADQQVMFNGREVSTPLDPDQLPDDVATLKRMLQDERFLRAAAEAAVVVLGKGASPVSNREKTEMVICLSNKGFAQKLSQDWAVLAKATFHRLRNTPVSAVEQKHYARLKLVASVCCEVRQQQTALVFSAGYRQITAQLRKKGITMSEKLVRTAMAELGTQATRKGARSYSSYQGENTHVPANLLMVDDQGVITAPGGQSQHFIDHGGQLTHDFSADKPGQRFVTDISEIKCKDGKLYLSPLIDLYDKDITSCTVGFRPNTELVLAMLETGLATIKQDFPDEVPVIHSDRGFHYRTNAWIKAIKDESGQRFIPSMSRKGQSGDNAACEGFFGLMKQELGFLRRNCERITKAEAIWRIDNYIQWYRYHRIHEPLGGKTIAEHRGWTTTTHTNQAA